MRRRSGGDFSSSVAQSIDETQDQSTLGVSPSQSASTNTAVNEQDSLNHEDAAEKGRWHLRHPRPSSVSVDYHVKPYIKPPERSSTHVTSNTARVLIGKRMRKPAEVIPICGLCLGTYELNKQTNLPEDLIACWACGQSGHPTCLKMPPDLVGRIRQLRWRCVDCKRCCLCQLTSRTPSGGTMDPSADKDLLLCDSCDRGFHMSCLVPAVSELPEGTWMCPICSPLPTSKNGLIESVDPRLEAITVCDKLTQHEIDWMHSILNTNQDQVNSTIPEPQTLANVVKCCSSALNQHAPTKNSTYRPLSPKFRKSGGDPIKNTNSTSVKASKRLVQKSLSSWAVSKNHHSPKKLASHAAAGTASSTSAVSMSPVAPRPRRTSAVASQAWQSLVRRRTSQEAVKRESSPINEDDDDKTDILMGDSTDSLSQKSPVRNLFPMFGRSNLRIRRRGASRLQLLNRRSQSKEKQDLVQYESMSSPVIRSQSPKKTLLDTQPIQSPKSSTSEQIPKMEPTSTIGSPSKGRRRKNWRQTPSLSTLRRWSSLGVNIKRALNTFHQRGRVKLSLMQRYTPRHRGTTRPSGVTRRPQHRSIAADSETTSSEDDDSSVTVAAANDATESENKKTPKPAPFDPFKDECPEFGVVTEENRALFASIQADVQASLPQPLESSKTVPPVNNPKCVPTVDSTSQDSALQSNQGEAKAEEPRYPPRIQLGRHLITTWYSAPYPSEYARLNLLYICEFCLKYSKTRKVYLRHIEKCPYSFPPGNEIYRCGNVSVFEVDGYTSRLYCQQLCLLAKLFLDHKTLYYDVEPFLFYVVALREGGCFQLVGYFSKEKRSAQKYNLSCIMVLPPYQKAAYGRFLIDFSFLLSRIEDQAGSPEKPLSELGRLSYESYWRSKVLPFILGSLNKQPPDPKHPSGSDSMDLQECVSTIHQISTTTGIDPHDVGETIEQLASSIDLGPDKRPLIRFDKAQLLALKAKYDARSKYWIPIDEDCLRWSPLINPKENDTSAEMSGPRGDVRPSRARSRNARSSSNTTTTRSPRGLNPFTSPTNSPEPSPVPTQSEEGEHASGRRRLRSDSTTSSNLMSPQLPKTLESPALSSTVGRTRLSLRTRLGNSPLLNSTTNSIATTETSVNSLISPATRSTPLLTTREPLVNNSSERLGPRTAKQMRTNTSGNGTSHLTENGDITPPNDRWQHRKPRKRPGPSPCRKKPFFPNGPKPPDPPSPHGGPSTLGRPGLLSASTQARSRRLRLSQPNGSQPNNSVNQHAADQKDQSPTVKNEEKATTPSIIEQALQSTLSFRVNSSLPETNELSPLRPSHSSSPLRLTEKLLDSHLCGPSSPCGGSPPPLTPPPPTLSFLGGMDSVTNEPLSEQKIIVASHKVQSLSTVPPCLSLCESTCPASLESNVGKPISQSPYAPHQPVLEQILSKNIGENLPESRHRRNTIPSTCCPRNPGFPRPRSHLDSPLLLNPHSDNLGFPTLPPVPTLTLPTVGSPTCASSDGNRTSGSLDTPILPHTRSCPVSPADDNVRDVPLHYRQSGSSSLLQEALDISERPPATPYSSSRSPPLLPPPVLDILSKDFPVLAPLSIDSVPENEYQSHPGRDSQSPSPPLLTTIRPNTKQSEEYSTVHPPVLFPTETSLNGVNACSSTELSEALLASIIGQRECAYPVGLKAFTKMDMAEFSETSSLTTIPMYQEGEGDTLESDAQMLDASCLAESSSGSATLSRWTSPASRHSSEETVEMRLMTPSPPLLTDDAGCDLFSTAFKYKHDSSSRLLHQYTRFRRCSEPHLRYTLFPESPVLMQRENSCPSLLSGFGVLSDLSPIRSCIQSPDRKLSLSESCSYTMINFVPLSDNHPGQLEPQSQSTTNATPDSFVDDEVPCVHAGTELKLEGQLGWDYLVAESILSMPSSGDLEVNYANQSLIPCTILEAPLQKLYEPWENLEISNDPTITITPTQALGNLFYANSTEKPTTAFATRVHCPQRNMVSPNEHNPVDLLATEIHAPLRVTTGLDTSQVIQFPQSWPSELHASKETRRLSGGSTLGCGSSNISPLSLQKVIPNSPSPIAQQQSPAIHRRTPLRSPTVGNSPTIQTASPHSPIFTQHDKSPLHGSFNLPLSGSSHSQPKGPQLDEFCMSTERYLQMSTNTPVSYTSESDQHLEERTDRSSESSEFVSPDTNQLLSSSSSFTSGGTPLNNSRISLPRRISLSIDTACPTSFISSLPSSTVDCIVSDSAYVPSSQYLSPQRSVLPRSMPSQPQCPPSSVNPSYSLPPKSVNPKSQPSKRRVRRNSHKPIQPAPSRTFPISPSNRYHTPLTFSPLPNVSPTPRSGQHPEFSLSFQSHPSTFHVQSTPVLPNSFRSLQLPHSPTAVSSYSMTEALQPCPSTHSSSVTNVGTSAYAMTCVHPMEVYTQPSDSSVFVPPTDSIQYNSYTLPYSLQTEPHAMGLEPAFHSSTAVATTQISPFFNASCPTYPCVLPQTAQPPSQMLIGSQLMQPLSCSSAGFLPTNTSFESNPILMNHGVDRTASVAANPSFFSTSFQSPMFNSPCTDTLTTPLVPSHAGNDFTPTPMNFIPDPSYPTNLPNGFQDPQSQYMLPLCELPQYPTRSTVECVMPTTTSLINTIPSSGSLYPPGGVIDQAAFQAQPQQQFIFYPPMLFCSPNELQGSSGLEFPISPQRFSSFLPVMNGSPTKAPLPSSIHPLVGQHYPGWPRAELFPGQVLPQPPLAPPPHPMMPT